MKAEDVKLGQVYHSASHGAYLRTCARGFRQESFVMSGGHCVDTSDLRPLTPEEAGTAVPQVQEETEKIWRDAGEGPREFDNEYDYDFLCFNCTPGRYGATVHIRKNHRVSEVRGVMCPNCGCDMTTTEGK